MARAEVLGALLEPLYESVLEQQRLREFTQRLAAATDASITAVVVHDVSSGSADLSLIHGADPHLVSSGMAELDLHADPWVQRALPLLATGRVVNSEDLLPREEMRRTTAFNEYYRQIDVGQQVASVGYFDGESSVTLSICRGVSDPAFGHRELDVLNALTPHWVNAYAVQRRLSWLQQRVDSLEAAVLAVPLSMYLLDAKLNVVQMSAAAEQVLAEGKVLRLVGGKLRALSDANAFDDLMSCAVLDAVAQAISERTRAIVLRNRSGQAVYVARANPLHGCLQRKKGGVIALFLSAVEATRPGGLAAMTRQLYGLTFAESALAEALYRKADLALAADQVGISHASAHTRLKVIFDKTGERGQPALIRLMSTIAPFAE